MGNKEGKLTASTSSTMGNPTQSDLEEIRKKNELFAQQNELLRQQLELMEKTKELELSGKSRSIATARDVKASVVSSESGLGDSRSMASTCTVSSTGSTGSNSSGGGMTVKDRLDKLKVLNIDGTKYRILKMLGRGGFSKVYECLNPNNELRAIKCVDYDGSDQSILDVYAKEVKLLSALGKTGKVIKIYAAKHVPADKMLYCVMERGDTDLDTFFKKGKVDKLKMKFYWKEMLLAVKALHDYKIVHADLKPANFVLVGGTLKLIDLGLSQVIRRDMTNITCDGVAGTVDYISPEAFKSRAADDKIKIGTYSDVWSLGCILYEMLYGRPPFGHIPLIGLKLMAIGDSDFSISVPSTEADDLIVIDVLNKCLQRNPYGRASIDELLGHEYLTANADLLGLAMAARLARAMTGEDSD